jgi:hypothetical protein
MIREIKKFTFFAKESTCFSFEVRDITPKVTRSFSEVQMLRELLFKEFPGMTLPKLGAHSKTEVICFFQRLWNMPEILSSDLFYQFIRSESTEKLFNDYHRLHEAYQTQSYFFKLLSFKRPSFSNEIFIDVIQRSPNIPEVEKMPWADLSSFNDFCENQYACIKGSLGLIANLVTECSKHIQKVQDNLIQLEPIFTKLRMQFERLNTAKTIFPGFDRSTIHLNCVFEKLEKSSADLSIIIRSII